MSQTTYTIQAEEAFAGMEADFGSGALGDSISRANEEGSAVDFGVPCVGGTDPETQFILPATSGDLFLGILVHRHGTEHQVLNPGENKLADGEVGKIKRKGRVWVVCATGCTVGDDVYWEHPPGTAGQWRNNATNAVQVPNAQWAKTAGVGEIAPIDINLPG